MSYYRHLGRPAGPHQGIYQFPTAKQLKMKISSLFARYPKTFRNKEEFIQGLSLVNEEDLREAFPFLEKRLKNKNAFINSFSSIADIIFYELFPDLKNAYRLWSGDIRNGDLKALITTNQILIYKDIFKFALKHAQTGKRMGWGKWRQKIFIQYLQETKSVNTNMILAMSGLLNNQSYSSLEEYERSFIKAWENLNFQREFSLSITNSPPKSKFKELAWANLRIKHAWEA